MAKKIKRRPVKTPVKAPVEEISTQRFNELLEQLQNQGKSQVDIAARARIPAQYLSDIKRGQRPVTELVARRLGEEFDFDYRWLLGTSDSKEIAPKTTAQVGDTVWLPLLPRPFVGDPRQSHRWNGAFFPLTGIAAGKIGPAEHPYVLRIGYSDEEGRLQKGDLVLISQTPNLRAEIQLVSYSGNMALARANDDGTWRRVAKGKEDLSSNFKSHGHCLGIVWSPLV